MLIKSLTVDYFGGDEPEANSTEGCRPRARAVDRVARGGRERARHGNAGRGGAAVLGCELSLVVL